MGWRVVLTLLHEHRLDWVRKRENKKIIFGCCEEDEWMATGGWGGLAYKIPVHSVHDLVVYPSDGTIPELRSNVPHNG